MKEYSVCKSKLRSFWLVALAGMQLVAAFRVVACPTSCTCLNEVVDCTGGNLTRPPQLGDMAINVTTLILDRNAIAQLTYEDFKGFSNLVKLSIAYNLLSELGNGTFVPTVSLLSLDLSYNQLSAFDAPELCSYAQLVQNVSLANNYLRNQPDFSRCSSLNWLNFSNNKIAQANNLSLPFSSSSALTLDFSGNALKKLSSGDFANCSVSKLILKGNALSAAAPDVWDEHSLAVLIELDLSENLLDSESIRNLSRNIGNSHLLQLNLAGNQIQQLENISLSNSVSDLDLSRNKLEQVEWGSAAPSGIISLSLRANSLVFISNASFASLIILRRLDLSSCNLSVANFDTRVFAPLSLSTSLDLSKNALAELTREDFLFGQTALAQLDLSNQFPLLINISKNLFDYAPELQTLDLRGNAIGRLPPSEWHFFDSLRKLQTLYLDDNGISVVLHGALGSTKMKKLSVNYNKLKGSDLQSLAGDLITLEELQAANNSVELLEQPFIASLPSLKLLDLRGNVFDCDSRLCYFSSWLVSTTVHVEDYQNYRCSDGKLVVELASTDLCYSPVTTSPNKPSEFPLAVVIVVAVGALLIVFIIFLSLISKYRQRRRREVSELRSLLPESNRIPTGYGA